MFPYEKYSMASRVLPAPPVRVPADAYLISDEIRASALSEGVVGDAREVLERLAEQAFELPFYLAMVRDIYAHAAALAGESAGS